MHKFCGFEPVLCLQTYHCMHLSSLFCIDLYPQFSQCSKSVHPRSQQSSFLIHHVIPIIFMFLDQMFLLFYSKRQSSFIFLLLLVLREVSGAPILVLIFTFCSFFNCLSISLQASHLILDGFGQVFCFLLCLVILEAGLFWVPSLLLADLSVSVSKLSISCCYSIISNDLNSFFQVFHSLSTFQQQAYRKSNHWVYYLNQITHFSFILSQVFQVKI